MVRLVIFMTSLYNDVIPSAVVLPHVYHACQELMDANFTHKSRSRIAAKYNIHPNMLIPRIPIELITFDDDPFIYKNGEKIRKNIPGIDCVFSFDVEPSLLDIDKLFS